MEDIQSLTKPSNIGSGVLTQSNSGNGVAVGIQTLGPTTYLFLPIGYVSNSTITTLTTFNNRTLSGLGLTNGTYNYTWGIGSNAGTLTLQVGP